MDKKLIFPFGSDAKFTLNPIYKATGEPLTEADMLDLKLTIENKNRGLSFVPEWKWTSAGIEVEVQRESIPKPLSYAVNLDFHLSDTSYSDKKKDILHYCTVISFVLDCDVEWDESVIVEISPSYKGDDGVGVPKGGAPGQALVKKTSDDFDTEWKTLSPGTGTGDGNDGKTPVIGSITAESVPSTEDPSFVLTHTSDDGDGNPVYTGTIKIPKGKDGKDGDDGNDGKTPVFEIGTVETLSAGSQATASIVPDGVDAQGNPKYKVNFGIPKGADGSGDGGTINLAWEDIEGKPTWIGDEKPEYTADEVGSLPTAHNTDETAHTDIRQAITEIGQNVSALEQNVLGMGETIAVISQTVSVHGEEIDDIKTTLGDVSAVLDIISGEVV